MPDPQPSPSAEPPKRESWLNRFFSKIGDQLEDLSYVAVITGTGNTYAKIDPGSNSIVDELKNNEVTILARTNIELDGDITEIVSTKNGQGGTVNQEIMAIHKENMAVAIDNWNTFMKMILEVTKVIAQLAGLSNASVLDKLSLAYKA